MILTLGDAHEQIHLQTQYKRQLSREWAQSASMCNRDEAPQHCYASVVMPAGSNAVQISYRQ